MSNGDTFLTVTNEDIYKKIEGIEDDQKQAFAHLDRHNKRIEKIERSSIGLWVQNNPMKFIGFVLGFMSLIISDLRKPLWEYIISFF